ncbi:hypothetical protein ACH5RR_003590 [Cinchona calisaya]|uniref:Uncharacterized protein n=1 Tax=Cinchona calisaya TaxID=153742 RepID=A0ABD3AVW7_9GENT
MDIDIVAGRWMYCLSRMQSEFSPDRSLSKFIHDDIGVNEQGQDTCENEKAPGIEAIAVNKEVAGTQALVKWVTELVTSVRAVNKRLLKFERKIKKQM